ncbi:helicase carboxy-terminal domain protein (macronuclear) [Tetrahymena thermophila SB210]|uniref:Helicase carboxy-terminal domain protein n=1 Tax=Tetrahymena thermophila (strain SB210) TaxID=312017 RepID=Q23K02_TETTS|nr:helicase carboxy-terminal domain protein [Tetrahymena thermophila SB210]EAR97041.1 helicase carboxy-terminal domain protein [Tetrahymena thermophila SB210]|eukprot:XP_001017286.1 helicase carboxy-terminal domain protein [Tetrahymena thermophila SB210]
MGQEHSKNNNQDNKEVNKDNRKDDFKHSQRDNRGEQIQDQSNQPLQSEKLQEQNFRNKRQGYGQQFQGNQIKEEEQLQDQSEFQNEFKKKREQKSYHHKEQYKNYQQNEKTRNYRMFQHPKKGDNNQIEEEEIQMQKQGQIIDYQQNNKFKNQQNEFKERYKKQKYDDRNEKIHDRINQSEQQMNQNFEENTQEQQQNHKYSNYQKEFKDKQRKQKYNDRNVNVQQHNQFKKQDEEFSEDQRYFKKPQNRQSTEDDLQSQQQKQQKIQDLKIINQFCKQHFSFSLLREDENSWFNVNYSNLLSNIQLKEILYQMRSALKYLAEYLKQHIDINQQNKQFNNYEINYMNLIKLYINNIADLKQRVDQGINKKISQLINHAALIETQTNLDNSEVQFENKFYSQDEIANQLQSQQIVNQLKLKSENSNSNQQDQEIQIVQQNLQDFSNSKDRDEDNQYDEEVGFSEELSDSQNLDTQSDIKNLSAEQISYLSKFYYSILNKFTIALKMEKSMLARNLPSYQIKKQLIQQVEQSKNPFTLLIGTTGSGKTTQICQYILQKQILSDDFTKKIYCVQPKRLNCLTISDRVAKELHTTLGQEVGYIVGYQKHEQLYDKNKTRIIFITQAMFLSFLVQRIKKLSEKQQQLNQCRILSQISYILLDEVHERTVEADIIMGILKQCIDNTSNIKVILSSATVNTEKYLKFFQQDEIPMELCQIPGKIYEIDEIFCNDLYGSNVKKVVQTLKHVISMIQQGDSLHQGHILIFLTDAQDIEQCISECRKLTCIDFRKYILLALHNKTDINDQNKIFQDLVNPYTNQMVTKIIFATNIAESAITINNVTVVIDSGKENCLVYDPLKCISSMKEQNISKSSAIQRQGRAGRTCPGICYKLYTESEYESFLQDSIPEIQRINIDFSVLKLLECGIYNLFAFPFFENPGQQVLQNSITNLQRLGAINQDVQVTQLGKVIQFTELEPYQAKCLIEASKRDVLDQVLNIFAFMAENQSLFKKYEKDQSFEDNSKKSQIEIDISNYKNEYKSDFLFYNFLFNRITQELQNDKNFISKNKKIKESVFLNIYLSKRHLNQVINQAKKIFQNEFKVENQLLQDSEEVRIQKCMLCCYLNQIGTYTGSRILGFTNIYNEINFSIHRFSKFCKSEFKEGDCLFYASLENVESENYAQHISIFKREWLEDESIIPSNMMTKIQAELVKKIIPKYICNIDVSRYILLAFKKKYSEKINEYLKQLSQNNPKLKIFMIIDESSCSIKFLGSQEGEIAFKEQLVQENILRILNDERTKQRKNIVIRKYKESENYVVFGQGYQILDILLPHEYVKVRVYNFPSKIQGQQVTEKTVEQFFMLDQNKDYFNVFFQKNSFDKMAIYIVFRNYESAKNFLYQFNLNMPQQYKDIYIQGVPESRASQKLEIVSVIAEWPIAKSLGKAQIIFNNQIDRDATYNRLLYQYINGIKIKVFQHDPEPKQHQQLVKNYCININSLSQQTTEQDIKHFISNQYGGFENILIRREEIKVDETQRLQNIERYTNQLKTLMSKIVNEEELQQIQIQYDNPKKGQMKARIQFPKAIQAEKFQQLYNKQVFEQGRLNLYIQNQQRFTLKIKAYEIIKDQFEKIILKFKDSIFIDVKYADYEVLINLKSQIDFKQNLLQNNTQETQNLFKLITQQIKILFKPLIINFDIHPRDFIQQYEKNIQIFEKIQNQLKVCIIPTPKKAEIQVWFEEQNENAKQKIIQKIQIAFQQNIISQKLLKKKWYNQKQLQDQIQNLVRQNFISNYDEKQDSIIIKGVQSQLQKALRIINQECRLVQSTQSCKICFEDKLIEKIDNCGCTYCQDCLLQHVLSSAINSECVCCPDHKESLINIEDIKDFISQLDEEKLINDKINSQIDTWKNKKVNLSKFIRCTSINCDSFFGKKYYDKNQQEVDVDMPSELKCPECFYSFCLKQTTYGIMKLHNYHSTGYCLAESDQQVVEQLKKLNYKQCPGCNDMIQKSMGCNHMTCKCGAHFCFQCLYYPTPSNAQAIYSHMATERH